MTTTFLVGNLPVWPQLGTNSAQALCRTFGSCNFGRTFVHLKHGRRHKACAQNVRCNRADRQNMKYLILFIAFLNIAFGQQVRWYIDKPNLKSDSLAIISNKIQSLLHIQNDADHPESILLHSNKD